MNGTVPKYDLFLSYNSRDQKTVAEIRQLLQQLSQSLDTFIDRESLALGKRWFEEIQSALLDSRAVAVFYGHHGLGGVGKTRKRRKTLPGLVKIHSAKPSGQKKRPNQPRLYDISGNVREGVRNCEHDNRQTPDDTSAWQQKDGGFSGHVLSGSGSRDSYDFFLRSAIHFKYDPDNRNRSFCLARD